jgi:hypothetical protein
MINPPTSFAAHTTSASGTHHFPNEQDLYGTLHYVNYHRPLDTQIANNALTADVQCKEVCVYCFKVFKVASQYIAHADTHKDADMTKNFYTRQICDRLRDIAAERLNECQLKSVETKKRTRELAGTPGARRVKGKLDVDDAITSSSPSHFPSFTGINSLSSDEASLQPVLASALHPNSIGASVPIETLDEYGAPIFWAFTYPSNQVAQQFSGEIGDIQTSIMDPSSNLGVGEYSTMPPGVQEGYMFRNPHNGAEEYHGQS